MTDNQVLHPVPLPRNYREGEDIPSMSPWPAEMLPHPMASHGTAVWYAGPDLSCMVYESEDGTVAFQDLPYDEHVVLLQGKAVLTSEDGTVNEYVAGDVFLAPRGWTGTWEMSGGYREMICFGTRAINAAAKHWWPNG